MGWGNKAIEIRSVESGHLDGVFMHKKAQKLKFLCERNDKVGSILVLPRVSTGAVNTLVSAPINLIHNLSFISNGVLCIRRRRN